MIVRAARAEFLANGYAATGMSAVARRAGISTKTLYRLVPTKADLFRSVISERIDHFMLEIDEPTLAALDLKSALERILVAYGRLTLGSEVIAINRLVLGEGDRFPEIATSFYENAIRSTNERIVSWLDHQCRQGLLKLDDPMLASGMLRGMMIMEPQRAAMLRQRQAPDAEEIAARAKKCATLFLSGCEARSSEPQKRSGSQSS